MARTPGEQVGFNVRQAREKLGLSQEALADAADLHRTEISHIERATRDVRVSTVVRVARALRVEPAQLLRNVH